MNLFLKNRVLPLLLALSLLSSSIAHAESPFSDADKATCGMMFLSPDEQEEVIADALSDLKKSQKGYRKFVAQIYSARIEAQVLETCSKKPTCSRADILQAVVKETEKVFGMAHKKRGYFLMGTLMVAGVTLSKTISKFTGGDPMVAFLIGQQVNRFMNHFQTPFDALIDPKLRKWVFKMTGTGAETATKAENQGFKKAFSNMQATYSGLERDGRGVYLGAQNDLTNHLLALQNYLQLDATPNSAVKLTDDDFARMLGSLLYEGRIFHADISPRDPQMLALFGPSVRPLAPLYDRLSKKVWAALNELELQEAHASDKTDYDRASAQKYYDELIDAWFHSEPAPLKSMDGLQG